MVPVALEVAEQLAKVSAAEVIRIHHQAFGYRALITASAAKTGLADH